MSLESKRDQFFNGGLSYSENKPVAIFANSAINTENNAENRNYRNNRNSSVIENVKDERGKIATIATIATYSDTEGGGEISEISKISNDPTNETGDKLAGHENLIVTCYTPNGDAIQIRAKDQGHAEWLVKMNPKPNGGVQ